MKMTEYQVESIFATASQGESAILSQKIAYLICQNNEIGGKKVIVQKN